MPKDTYLHVRCEPELIAALKRAAKRHRRKYSDFVRIVLEDYITAEENALHQHATRPYELNEVVPATPVPPPAEPPPERHHHPRKK